MPKGKLERVIGSHRGSRPGPLVIVTAGIHGNEAAGIPAALRVLELLGKAPVAFAGEMLALAGNLTALTLGSRFADEDLNRIWQAGRVATLPDGKNVSRESIEQRELLESVSETIRGGATRIAFLDLHTTSAPGAPFAVLADTPENRHLARPLPGTTILGLDTHLDGTFLSYINGLGYAAVGFEGGQHDDPLSVDAHELAILETLVLSGCLGGPPSSRFDELLDLLQPITVDIPAVVEIIHRHALTPGDGFVMEPGFKNLQLVQEGELLARDRRGDIRASEDARILMPLYQDQGDDGFFLAKEVPSSVR